MKRIRLFAVLTILLCTTTTTWAQTTISTDNQ